MTRPFTGWHMVAILISFFAVVVGVNLLMARFATATFGGVQVENSYVASQNFNRWLDAAEQSAALGWRAEAALRDDGLVEVIASGPGAGARLAATARHPLGRAADRALLFDRQADGSFLSREPLPRERWVLRMEMREGEAVWRQEARL